MHTKPNPSSEQKYAALCIKRTNNLADFRAVVNHNDAMQDRTINNALLALRKQGGHEGKLAEVLLDMRGVEWTGWVQDKPFKRGDTKTMILGSLKERPMTSWELGGVLRQARPDIGANAASNRAYMALRRLRDKGLVRRDGRMWSLP